MPFIEIDGKKVEAKAGSMIIEVADNLNVQIPRFCYHKKLSIAANCRMCLVEIEKAPKPLPACATPITEGMKVWTRSPKALLAQKSVMEFLLINHPLDCPICDQGGECELQDLSVGYGRDDSRYTEGKRVIKDKDIGPLIATDMTRCIHCTRCVRYGTEIAGIREMGTLGRGECLEIGTYIEQSVTSEVSGNIIDLCPVGALTSKPFRFTARGWELKQTPGVAPHDCVGSNIFIHSRRNKVMRVVPRENELINESWIADRDRFSYEALSSEDRQQQPKIKQDGQWKTVSWQEALEYTARRMLEVVQAEGPEGIGSLISPNATLEECYLLQKLMRALGSHNIDHRLNQSDFRHQEGAPLCPGLGVPIAEIEQQSLTLLIGSDIRKEQPILGLKLRKMTLAGGKVLAINPVDFSFNFELTAKKIVSGGDLVLGLAQVVKALLKEEKTKISKEVSHWLAKVVPGDADIEMAKHLLNPNEKKLILVGYYAVSHPAFSHLISLINIIVQITGAKFGMLTPGSNSPGAWLAGCVPHRLVGGKAVQEPIGLDATQMFEKNLRAYLLFNVEPELDSWNGAKALEALAKAELVVAITPFANKALYKMAHVILPMTPFSETSGTWINIEGQWQSFKAAVAPLGESRPGWKILRVLGNLCDCPGFDFGSSEQVLACLREEILAEAETTSVKSLHTWEWWCPLEFEHLGNEKDIIRIAPISLYAIDNLVRRADSLQKTEAARNFLLHLNSALANRLKLVGKCAKVFCNGFNLTIPFVIDEAVPDNSVVIPAAIDDCISLGGPYAVVKIQAI